MAERARNRIGKEDKERLVRAYNSPEQDYLAIADVGINRSSARGIIACYIRENRVDGTAISAFILIIFVVVKCLLLFCFCCCENGDD